jgi:hypothetical protein
MASFTLQPGLTRLANISQPGCDNSFTPYPTHDSRPNWSSRPQFSEFCHSPYMAGKGVPGHLILEEDAMRPQSTKRFGKVLVNTYERNFFPLQDNLCLGQPQTARYNPVDTRAQLQNGLFQKRYPNA